MHSSALEPRQVRKEAAVKYVREVSSGSLAGVKIFFEPVSIIDDKWYGIIKLIRMYLLER